MWKSGEWINYCQVCGRRVDASQIIRRWDGLLVEKSCWEARHPLDFVRSVKDNPKLPFYTPQPGEVDVSPIYTFPPPGDILEFCTPDGRRAIPSLSIPACMIPEANPEAVTECDPSDLNLGDISSLTIVNGTMDVVTTVDPPNPSLRVASFTTTVDARVSLNQFPTDARNGSYSIQFISPTALEQVRLLFRYGNDGGPGTVNKFTGYALIADIFGFGGISSIALYKADGLGGLTQVPATQVAIPWAVGTFVTADIVMNENHIQVYFDDVLKIDYTDALDSFPTGGFGLTAYSYVVGGLFTYFRNVFYQPDCP